MDEAREGLASQLPKLRHIRGLLLFQRTLKGKGGGLHIVRGEVGISLRHFQVAVPHELRQREDGCPCLSQPRGKSMP